MGDLTVTFICPDGSSIGVHQQGGGGTFLGEPVDNDADPDNPGVGYDYFWSTRSHQRHLGRQRRGHAALGNVRIGPALDTARGLPTQRHLDH